MLRRPLYVWVLVGLVSGRAAELALPPPAPAVPAVAAQPAPDGGPLLPLHLPGYDLRVLETKKPLLFNVAGTWVEVSVPIFFYLATPAHDEGVKRLRQVADDLRQLTRKPAWTSAELGRLEADLEAAAALLAQP